MKEESGREINEGNSILSVFFHKLFEKSFLLLLLFASTFLFPLMI